MPNKDLRNTGLNLASESVEEMDRFKREWDALESRNITRSDIGREIVPLGLTAWQVMIDEFGTEAYRIPTRERKALVRQALLDFFGEHAPDE